MNATRRARRHPILSPVAFCSQGQNSLTTRRAFTLLEVLLALGLIGLLAAVLIGGSARLLDDKPLSTDEVFWKACGEARKAALNSGHDVRLAFAVDRDNGPRFTIDDGSGPRGFPIKASGELTVNFLSGQKLAGSAIMAGQVVETQSLPFVTFYPDGTCTAFRLQIRFGADAHILSIDPWTCAQVLTPPEGHVL